MRRRALAIVALTTTLGWTAAVAGPLIMEETAKVSSPDPASSFFPLKVAVDGDTIIATGLRSEYTFEPYEHLRSFYSAFLFQRQSSGSWAYVRTLAQTDCDEGERGEQTCPISVAMRNGVAAVSAGQLHVFTRTANGDWIEAPSTGLTGPGDVAIGTGVVLTSHPVCDGLGIKAFRPNASGVWTQVFLITSDDNGCDRWGLLGRPVDMSAENRWLVSDPSAFPEGLVHIFEPGGSGWSQVGQLTSGIGVIDSTHLFTGGPFDIPIHVFNRVDGTWTHSTDITVPDSAVRDVGIVKARNLLFAKAKVVGGDVGSVSVFRGKSSGQYEEIARLYSSALQPRQEGNSLFADDIDAYVNGAFVRVVASGPGGLHVFDLNAIAPTSAPKQEDFEQGNAANWTPIAGSTFSVVSAASSRVYRQSSTTGDAGSYFTSINWANQAIEADVRPTAFNGTGRWVGLAVRRTDASNYYYVILSQNNFLDVKRMANGKFVSLASVPMTVELNRNYRLRLEAVGTHLRAYVDGRLAVETTDTVLKQGHAGLQMYKARADFDNVIFSHDPHVTLLEHRVPYILEDRWSFNLGSWSFVYRRDTPARLVQQAITGDARAITRVAAKDQIVQVAATANAFAAGTGSRWFGPVARYVDANNFYYVVVRSNNTISLRKLVNGTSFLLDTAPFNVTAGTTYTLRLAAVGTSLRTWVNGNLVLEANDSSHASGKYGLATYKTAATFDDFVAWQP